MEGLCPDKFAFVERSGTMKSPAGTLSDRTVLPKARWRGFAPTSSAERDKREIKNKISAEDGQNEVEAI